jgi:hypothetical protein
MIRSLRRRINTLLAGLAVFAGMLVQAAPAAASVEWSANAERPWNQEWANYSCQDGTRVQEVTSPAAQGQRAYRIELRDGDDSYGERCELGMGNPTRNGFPLFHQGDERWISFQVYLPDDYPINAPSWNVFYQQKQLGSMGTPVIAMEVNRGRFTLVNSNNNGVSGDKYQLWNGPATANRWVWFTVHTKFSPDAATGSIELFGDLDGQGMKLLMPETHTYTMKQDNGQPVPVHARIGMYRDAAINGTSHILFDGFTIATDRASAEAGASGREINPVVVTPPPPIATPPVTTTPPATTPPVATPPVTTPPVTTVTTTPPPTKKKRPRRVVLRTRRSARAVVRSSGVWPSVVPVYGWVKRARRLGGRSVIIEIRQNGRWQSLARGWLRRNGRFYLAVALDAGDSHEVMLRAHVAGVGNSNAVAARL